MVKTDPASELEAWLQNNINKTKTPSKQKLLDIIFFLELLQHLDIYNSLTAVTRNVPKQINACSLEQFFFQLLTEFQKETTTEDTTARSEC